jgi:GAF domain-containing protein
VPVDRRARMLGLLAGDELADPATRRLAKVSAQFTNVSGAGIMLMSGDIQRGAVAVSDDVAGVIEELQYTLGEGPCLDAYREDRPVLEPDLAAPNRVRWTAFSAPAVQAGVRSVFGFPLRVGGVRLGALNLYRDQPGPLSDDQHADALVAADVVCRALLTMQDGAEPGTVSETLGQETDFAAVVHQASGMVSLQLGVSVADALIRLRAYAFANNRHLSEVGAVVVARKLRFDTDPAPGSGPSGHE